MIRVLIAAVVGGIILFMWGAVSWMFIPWHEMEVVPQQDSMRQTLSNANLEAGVYRIPWMDMKADVSDEVRQQQEEAFGQAHREGPIATIFYQPQGGPPMPASTFVKGFLVDVLAAGLAAIVLKMAAPAIFGYFGRVLLVMLIGSFMAVWAHGSYWNYMNFPLRYSLEVAADGVVGSLLLGLALAAIINPMSMSSTVSTEFSAGT